MNIEPPAKFLALLTGVVFTIGGLYVLGAYIAPGFVRLTDPLPDWVEITGLLLFFIIGTVVWIRSPKEPPR